MRSGILYVPLRALATSVHLRLLLHTSPSSKQRCGHRRLAVWGVLTCADSVGVLGLVVVASATCLLATCSSNALRAPRNSANGPWLS
jgi:hypothetical protein